MRPFIRAATLLIALTLGGSGALGQVSPGTSPLAGSKGGTGNAFMQFTGPATSIKTYTLPNASDTIALLTQTQTLTNKTLANPTITGTVIAPTVVGGTAAGATITLQSTNNGVPSGDTVNVTGSSIILKAFTGSNTAVTVGNPGGSLGQILMAGNASGTTMLRPAATASGTLTLPAATDTLVGKATTDVLINKTFDTAGTGNSFSINGVAANANTGTGAVARATSPTFVTPALGAASATTINGVTIDNNAWSTYTPTVTAGSGTPTTITATGRSKQIGKMVISQMNVIITDKGTAAGALIVSLPVTASAFHFSGSTFEYQTTGKSGASFINGPGTPTTLSTRDATATEWWVNGYRLAITITYEAS